MFDVVLGSLLIIGGMVAGAFVDKTSVSIIYSAIMGFAGGRFLAMGMSRLND